MNDCITVAKQYRECGLSVIPLQLDGTKSPKVKWGEFRGRHATDVELETWFASDESGIGVVCGQASGGLHVIDFDGDAENTFDAFWSELSKRSPEIVSRLVAVKTPRPGRHVWFRQETPVPGNSKLAVGTDSEGKKRSVSIETRGEGGYVVAPGGPNSVHPSNIPYEFVHGSVDSIGVLSAAEVETVLSLCRSLNQHGAGEEPSFCGSAPYSGPPRPGDVFNEHADILELLLQAEWTVIDASDDETLYLARPGKEEQGHSATLGHIRDSDGRPCLYVFSSNADPFEPDRTYKPFDVFCLTQHGGDYSKAAVVARELYAQELQVAERAYYGEGGLAVGDGGVSVEVPFKPFPLECFPEAVRDYVAASAEAINIDPAYVAVPMLSVLAAAIGGSRSIELKAGWNEPSIIWTVTIAPVSSGKTPGWEAATRPLKKIQNQLHDARIASQDHYRQLLTAYEQAKAAGEKDLVKPKPPQHTVQLLVNDITMEALAEVAKNNTKLLLSIDELAAWYRQMNQYRPGRDTENWLSAYNGSEINVNRKKDKEHIWVPRTCISVTGTTQPAVAQSLIFSEQAQENGLAARLLSARPPAQIVRWTDKEVEEGVVLCMNELAERLYMLKGHSGDSGGESPMVLPCTPSALNEFKIWMDDAAKYAESMPAGLRTSWLKIRPVAARLALILSVTSQVFQSPQGDGSLPVDAASMRAGIQIAKWFGYEIERNSSESRLRLLHDHLGWILGKYPDGVDVRLFQMGRRRSISSANDARAVLSELAERGYGTFCDDSFVPAQGNAGLWALANAHQ